MGRHGDEQEKFVADETSSKQRCDAQRPRGMARMLAQLLAVVTNACVKSRYFLTNSKYIGLKNDFTSVKVIRYLPAAGIVTSPMFLG
jgi:hypothetical protein